MAEKKSGKKKAEKKLSKIEKDVKEAIKEKEKIENFEDKIIDKNEAPLEKKKEKQTEIIVASLIGILVFIIAMVIIISSLNNFSYNGIKFEKIRYGEILLYEAKVPAYDASGNLQEIKVDFRNDPRKLKDISFEEGKSISFYKPSFVYLSIDPEAEKCDDAGISVVNFGALFLRDIGYSAKVASSNEEQATKQNLAHITCSSQINNTIIMISKEDKTEITNPKQNCYEISFANCEDVSRAIEKFQLQFLKQHIELTGLYG